jgi:asparagine synthase (glutamine-hydrolysing)
MCGIAGKLHWGTEKETSVISSMLNKMVHRGPDDSGVTHLEEISLGHRRLSIIDLSPDAKQPMVIDDRYYITFNGEIYNYLEIRAELEKDGCLFKTKSDTEVILRAYQKWREKCLSKFNGMWAFVIWDDKEKELFTINLSENNLFLLQN